MSTNLIIIIFGWQLIIVFTQKPSLDEVRSLIKKVQSEAATVRNSNEELHSQMSKVETESVRKITDYSIEKYNLSSEFKEEMDKLKILQSNLSSLYQEEQSLNRKSSVVQNSKEKLELGMKLLQDDIQQLESRRKSGDEETCFKLVPLAAENKIIQRSANSSEEDEMIVLANELQHEKSKLDELANKNTELKMALQDKKSLSETALLNLETTIKEIDGDVSKAKARVNILREKCDSKKAEISSLWESYNEDVKFVDDQKQSLEKLRGSIVEFGRSVKCYNRIEDEILHNIY